MGTEPDEAASLRERMLQPQTADQQRADQDAAAASKRSRLRQRLITAGVWSAALALIVSSCAMNSATSSAADAHWEELEQRGEAITEAQGRIYDAEDGIGFLPDEAQAQRWMTWADTAGERLAGYQNVYLQNTGPIDPDDGPRFDAEGFSFEGFSAEDAEQDDPLQAQIEYEQSLDENQIERLIEDGYELDDEQRVQLIAAQREENVSSLLRYMQTDIDSESRGDNAAEFNALSRWDDAVDTLDAGADDEEYSLAGYIWQYSSAEIYSPDGTVPMQWRLVSADDEPVAWVFAQFNPQSRVIEDFSVGFSAEHEQDGG